MLCAVAVHFVVTKSDSALSLERSSARPHLVASVASASGATMLAPGARGTLHVQVRNSSSRAANLTLRARTSQLGLLSRYVHARATLKDGTPIAAHGAQMAAIEWSVDADAPPSAIVPASRILPVWTAVA
jgi:hypothetical protein